MTAHLRMTLWADAVTVLGSLRFDHDHEAMQCLRALGAASSPTWGLEPVHGTIALVRDGRVRATLLVSPLMVTAIAARLPMPGGQEVVRADVWPGLVADVLPSRDAGGRDACI